jgi:hypothetical protein
VSLRAATATALALVCAFAAITVSVVRAREPLDRAVGRSFDATVTSTLERSGAAVTPFGCRKLRVNIYDCSALVRPKGVLESERRRYELTLRDDGCWSTRGFTQQTTQAGAPTLQGCIAD